MRASSGAAAKPSRRPLTRAEATLFAQQTDEMGIPVSDFPSAFAWYWRCRAQAGAQLTGQRELSPTTTMPPASECTVCPGVTTLRRFRLDC